MYKFFVKELVSMGERCLNWQIVFSKYFYEKLITDRDLNLKLLRQNPGDEAIVETWTNTRSFRPSI